MKRLLRILGYMMVFMLATAACAEKGTLELPIDTLRIESEAFYGLENISEVVLPDGLEYIGSRVFAESGLILFMESTEDGHGGAHVLRPLYSSRLMWGRFHL